MGIDLFGGQLVLRNRPATTPVLASGFAVALLTSCSGSPGAETSASEVDPEALAVQACIAVDGSAHAELSDGGLNVAQWEAQATDQELAADDLTKAAAADSKYQAALEAMNALADQTRTFADAAAASDTDRLTDLLTADDPTAPIVRARAECHALGLATK